MQKVPPKYKEVCVCVSVGSIYNIITHTPFARADSSVDISRVARLEVIQLLALPERINEALEKQTWQPRYADTLIHKVQTQIIKSW